MVGACLGGRIRPGREQPRKGTSILRLTERRDLLRALNRLASSDPAERDRGALRAAELVRRRGIDWDDLLLPSDPPARARPHSSDCNTPKTAWPAAAIQLLANPGLTGVERDFLTKVCAWRRLGRDGIAQVEVIARRLAGSPSARGHAQTPDIGSKL